MSREGFAIQRCPECGMVWDTIKGSDGATCVGAVVLGNSHDPIPMERLEVVTVDQPRVVLDGEVQVGDRLVVTAIDHMNGGVRISPDNAPRAEMARKSELDAALDALAELVTACRRHTPIVMARPFELAYARARAVLADLRGEDEST